MATGFQRDVRSGCRSIACAGNRIDFSVSFSELLVIAVGDQSKIGVDHYCTNRRIGLNVTDAFSRKIDRVLHDSSVIWKLMSGWKRHRLTAAIR